MRDQYQHMLGLGTVSQYINKASSISRFEVYLRKLQFFQFGQGLFLYFCYLPSQIFLDNFLWPTLCKCSLCQLIEHITSSKLRAQVIIDNQRELLVWG